MRSIGLPTQWRLPASWGSDDLIPSDFGRAVFQMHGASGIAWLEGLPKLLDELGSKWDIRLIAPCEELSYNFVAFAVDRSGKALVLKVGMGSAEADREPLALTVYNGRGAVRLLNHDTAHHAMLIEQIEPGSTLRTKSEDDSMAVVADVLERLWQPNEDARFPQLGKWTRALDAQYERESPIANDLLRFAIETRDGLLDSSLESVLLHGDLHHGNILWSFRGEWLAIDPKGVRGEKAYDLTPYLLNAEPSSLDATISRIGWLCNRLCLDRSRVIAWTFVQAVVSACWSIEDNGDFWDAHLDLAQKIRPLLA